MRYLTCLKQWKTLAVGPNHQKLLIKMHQVELKKPEKKWRAFSHSLLDVNKSLSFCGPGEDMPSSANKRFLVGWEPIFKKHFTKIKYAIFLFIFLKGGRFNSYLQIFKMNSFIFRKITLKKKTMYQ